MEIGPSLNSWSFVIFPSFQFRFANWLDLLMIAVGVVTGILSGAALPGHMLLFGEVINQFVYYSIATEEIIPRFMDFVGNETRNTLNETLKDLTCVRSRADTVLAMFSENGTDIYLCEQGEGNDIFSEVVDFVCDPADTLQDNVALYAYYYLAMAVGVLITTFVANALLNLSAYRQTRRMRLAFFRSVLSQEIGWFDVTASAQLSTRLAE